MRTLGVDPTGMRNADGAARGRVTEMKAAGMLFLEYPVLGAGPGLAPYYYEENATIVGGKVRSGTRRSHNLYLQLAAETGIVGLSAFVLFVGLVFRELDRTRRQVEHSDRELWAVVCGLELALVISLATSFFLHAAYVRYFWMLIGFSCAATLQPPPPALVAFLSRALHETADRIRRDQARA
jgi:O-antigen ligase